MLPERFREWDMNTYSRKRKVRRWVKKNIPQVWDKVFRGVLKTRKKQMEENK